MGFYRTMSVVVSGCVLAGVAWTFSARDAGRRLPLRLLRKMLLHNELRHEDFFGPVDCFLRSPPL